MPEIPNDMKTSPAGLPRFFHEIGGDSTYYENYDPSELEKKYQWLMHSNIEEGLTHRWPQEHKWKWAARRWAQLADPINDDRLSNVMIPIVKTIIMSRLASMNKGEMEVQYIPGTDDGDLAEVWQDARRFVNTKCNHRMEMQRGFLLMSLFGPCPLYDGYRSAYQTIRVPQNDGAYRETVVRDPRRSMIFTEAISPWSYIVGDGNRYHEKAPHHTYVRYMQYDKWVSEFARVPKWSGKPLYMHTRSVQPGKGWKANKSKERLGIQSFEQMELSHKMVCVNYHWIPHMDLHLIESNGVLNWAGPNPYLHKRSPFSMLKLHAQLNRSGTDIGIYGDGDAHLLSALDTLYQNVMNMFVDNFYFSNSSVIGVPTGLNLDIDDEEFYGGTVIKGGEKMVVNQLGQVDGQSYNFMWKMLNDLLVWASGVPFNQLVPEGQITAYELSKRLDKANERQSSILAENESDGFKASSEKQISNIFQFLPQEDFYQVSDPEQVDRLIEEGKIPSNDVVYENGTPVMVRTYPMLETKGRVIKEKFVNNLPIPDQAEVIERGNDGRLAARPENILPTEWYRNNGIPDLIVDSKTLFGPENEMDKQNTIEAAQLAFAQNDRAALKKKPEPFNEDEIMEDMVRVIKKNPRKWLKKNSDSGTKLADDVDTKETERQMREVIAERDGVEGQEGAPIPSAPAQPTSGGKPQSEGGLVGSQAQQLSSAATGQ